MVSVLRPGQCILHIPGIGVSTSRRTVGGGNGLLNNLIAYWALDEAAGANNALDKHSNALTLTQAASPGSAAGIVYSGARTFNGSSQYFSRASQALLQTGDVDFTLAAWVRLATKAMSDCQIINKWNYSASPSPKREYKLLYADTIDRFEFGLSPNGTSVSWVDSNTFGPLAISTWYFVLCQHDSVANTMAIFVNDVGDSVAYNSGVLASDSTFAIGRYSNVSGGYWNGRIGPVAMWKSAAGAGGVLTAAQRTALYAGGAGLPYASFTT